MLHAVTFTKDCRCFKKDDSFTFRPGVNLLVGDQGCGKSTILQGIRQQKEGYNSIPLRYEATKIQAVSYDFEKDNPRILSHFDKNIQAQVAAIFCSHGQSNNAILGALKNAKDILICLDEPDTSLSIRSIYRLIKNMELAVKNGCQLIFSVHNPIIIQHFPEVLSIEHRKWMLNYEFYESQLSEPATVAPKKKTAKKSNLS